MGSGALIYNDSNVYILGAGYSHDAGLPLVSEFTNRMRDAFESFERQGKRAERDAIGTVLEFRRQATGAAERVPLNLENIEEVFSLAAATGDVSLNRSAALAIAATLDFAKTSAVPTIERAFILLGNRVPDGWTIEREGNWGPRKGVYCGCSRYDLFALTMSGFPEERGLNRADSVITFNYDTLVEDSLHRLQIPFSYGFDQNLPDFDNSARCVRVAASDPTSAAAIHVLKPHGSINWAVQTDREKPKVFGTYEQLRSDGLNPLLAPPTWSKNPAVLLSDVWDNAVSAIRSATRIAIIGYSIPPMDLHFKYLLAAGLKNNNSLRDVFFVNPQARTLESRVESVFRSDLRPQIVKLVGSDCRTFLLNDSDSLNRGSLPTARCTPC